MLNSTTVEHKQHVTPQLSFPLILFTNYFFGSFLLNASYCFTHVVRQQGCTILFLIMHVMFLILSMIGLKHACQTLTAGCWRSSRCWSRTSEELGWSLVHQTGVMKGHVCPESPHIPASLRSVPSLPLSKFTSIID